MTSGTSYSPPPAFGRFKLLHQIGAGVLGPVFRTHDPEGDRLVAVKAFNLDITPEQAVELAAEFQRMVELGLEAPHLAVPVGSGVESFVAYLASQYVAGESLDAAIRQYGPAPAGDAARLISHIAEALDGAARVGVFHGALHPRDVLVTPGETHITGMGVAKALERIGLHGPIRRPYVAPERENGEEWGVAADVFSLAAISYEVMTGRRALPGTDQPLAGLADLAARDLGALREIIETGLDADPERRPSRAADFASAFANALLEGGVAPAGGDRAAGHRSRKPRVRARKLPGLDDPLIPFSATGAVGSVPPDDHPPAVVAQHASDAPVRELRYEPVEEPPPDTLAEVQVEPPAEPDVAEPELAAQEVAEPEVERASAVVAEPAAESPVEPTVEPPVEPIVEPVVEPTIEPPMEPTVEPPVEPAAEPAREPETAQPAEPVVKPPVEVRVRMRRRRGLVEPAPDEVLSATDEPLASTAEAVMPELAPAAIEVIPVAEPVTSLDRSELDDEPVASPAEAVMPEPAPAAVEAMPDAELVPPFDLSKLDDEPVAFTGEAVMPEPAPAAVEAMPDAELVPFDLTGLGDGPVADRPPTEFADLDDLKVSFTHEAGALADAGFTPDLRGLTEALSTFEAPEPETRSGDVDIPADEWRDPGVIASEPAIPRALDPLASSKSSRTSRTLEPEPYRPDLPVRRTRVPVAAGIGIGLLVAVIAGYLWWAGTSRPESILPPGTVADVTPLAASAPAGANPAVAKQAAPTVAPVPSLAVPATPQAAVATPPAVAAPAGKAPASAAPAVPSAPQTAAATPPAVVAPAPASAATVKPPTGAATAAPSPAPKAPASAAPATRADTGDIRVRSTPSKADVVVEGERRGVTPRNLRGLPYGTYTLRVTRPGYVGQERQVTLDARHRDVLVNVTLARVKAAARPAPAPGKPAAREATVNPTAVVVATSISVETRPPGVRVLLDGEDVGVSPITLSPVTPGSHRVDLSLPGYKLWSTTVTVAVGKRERITASLERDTPR